MAYRKFDNEYRKLAKAANERMRQLEKAGLDTGAYRGIQGFLKAAGVKKGKAAGLRFSETGKGSYNEREMMTAQLKKFLSSETSTSSKARAVYDRIWKTADEEGNLSSRGVTRQEYFDIWQNLPDDKRDRLFSSDVYINIVSAVKLKEDRKGVAEEDRLTVDDIVEMVENARDYKSALKSVGITYRDIKQARDLGRI